EEKGRPPGGAVEDAGLVEAIPGRLDIAVADERVWLVRAQELFDERAGGLGEPTEAGLVREPQRDLQEAGDAVTERGGSDSAGLGRPSVHRVHGLEGELAVLGTIRGVPRQPQRPRDARRPVAPGCAAPL